MSDSLDLTDARKRYHFAFAPEDHDELPFYSALVTTFEDDEVALSLLASVRVEQRNPMLILAALQLAGLRGHPVLGPLYEHVRHGRLDDPRGAAERVLEVLHHTPDVVAKELWRSTQTNEPGRSAVLQAVIRDLAGDRSSINVVEVGTSAGINLCFDQFPVRPRDDGNPLTLVCDDLTPVDRSRPLPHVHQRVGVDPYPLDLGNDDDRLWLKACLWPEQRRRHDRFDAVVAARPTWPRATMLRGTAKERLGEALSLCDDGALTIVVNTWVAFYLSTDERLEYFSELARRCRDDNVAWVSIESSRIHIPGVDVDEAAHHRAASQVVVTGPDSPSRRWGWCHAHGRWLERTTES
ncbi:MAG: hypothetical protein JWM55_956 [Acidimicrobiaceae bacterium]|nr:hypothetical protein [Acidimicrobiaceae bacterium]